MFRSSKFTPQGAVAKADLKLSKPHDAARNHRSGLPTTNRSSCEPSTVLGPVERMPSDVSFLARASGRHAESVRELSLYR